MEIEPALGLDDLARTNFPSRTRNHPTDLGVIKICRKIECLGEQTIAEQHAQGISPAGVDRRLGPTPLGLVHDVIVNEGGDMDQLDDHGQIEMARSDFAARSSAQK